MAKVVLIFEDGAVDQMISYYSDGNIDFTTKDLESLSPAEYLAVCAIDLLSDFVQSQGAKIEMELPDDAVLN